MESKSAKARAHVLVSGIVQGVFYRSSARDEARRNGLTGWVRNLPSGRVEAVLEGPRERVAAVISWCRQGPSGADVSDVDVEWEPYSGEFDCFSIVH